MSFSNYVSAPPGKYGGVLAVLHYVCARAQSAIRSLSVIKLEALHRDLLERHMG